MLFDLLRGNFDPLSLIVNIFVVAFVVFCTMPVHEFAHAFVATKLGDQTPRLSGRLTLNPMAHISPMGALMILLCGFGFAKPVSVNPRNFKDSQKGMALTAIAGPVSNLLMAFVFIGLGQIIDIVANGEPYYFHNNSMWYNPNNVTFVSAICMFLFYAAMINVNLAVFNLLPIPPLDGSRILQLLIPGKYYYKFLQYERYIVLVVFVLLFTNVLSRPLAWMTSKIMSLLIFV